jgi:hypothetical protein
MICAVRWRPFEHIVKAYFPAVKNEKAARRRLTGNLDQSHCAGKRANERETY